MIRSNMKALLLAGVALGVAGSAVAADDQKLEKPFRLSVGAFFPSDREIRDITDNVHFAFGLSYDFWRRKSGQAGNDWAAALYFDGTFRDKDDNRLTNLGFGLNARVYLGEAQENAARFYLGAGLGGYSVHWRVAGLSESKFVFGGKGFLGVETPSGFFAELNYTWIDNVEGENPGGFMAMIGFRF
ncbi:MAG TPA: hypothetical protein PLH94_03660 [Fimbriimonadaceae bacterium]|nr:hypothetical protein [Fimbriimonadaceae bacterium]